MARKEIQTQVSMGRPSDFSGDVVERIIKEYQRGRSLYQISQDDGMPSYMTLVNWRNSRRDFFYVLRACDEDRAREAMASIAEIAKRVKEVVCTLTHEELMASAALVNAATGSFDKIAKGATIEGEPPPEQEDDDTQRERFDDLHPLTQDKIREALLEDRRLRGEGEQDV